MNRRRFLKTSAAATAALSLGSLTSACTSPSAQEGDAGSDGAAPDVPNTGAAVPETSIPDAMEDDTAAPDTAAPDTAAPDTVAVDTSAPATCDPTTSDLLGPYYEAGAPVGMRIASVGEAGQHLRLNGTIVGADCGALAGATIEVWQADDAGDYFDDKLRGQLTVGSDGAFVFDTIVPGRYLQSTGFRPAHIHARVSAEGYQTLVTQLYFQGDPYLADSDSCGVCSSRDPDRYLALEDGQGGVKQAAIALSLEPA